MRILYKWYGIDELKFSQVHSIKLKITRDDKTAAPATVLYTHYNSVGINLIRCVG